KVAVQDLGYANQTRQRYQESCDHHCCKQRDVVCLWPCPVWEVAKQRLACFAAFARAFAMQRWSSYRGYGRAHGIIEQRSRCCFSPSTIHLELSIQIDAGIVAPTASSQRWPNRY